MELEVGSVLTGKVVTITKFGAFVSIAPGKAGLVHISEIAATYVNDVNDFLTVGQEVKVKVISIDQNGRVNLSIKQAMDPPAAQSRRSFGGQERRSAQPRGEHSDRPARGGSYQSEGQVTAPSGDAAFEDKLKRFMQDSESKMSGSKQFEKRTSRRRGSWGGGGEDY